MTKLVHVVDDIFYNKMVSRLLFYHNCSQDYLTDTGDGSFRTSQMRLLSLKNPLKCYSCHKVWEEETLNFLKLMEGVRGE
jgi:hypothetical protein